MKRKAPLCTKRAFFILYFIRLNAIEEKLEVIEEQVDEERGKDEVTLGVFGENTNSKDPSIVSLQSKGNSQLEENKELYDSKSLCEYCDKQ